MRYLCGENKDGIYTLGRFSFNPIPILIPLEDLSENTENDWDKNVLFVKVLIFLATLLLLYRQYISKYICI
jgi:hypothetical protein